MYRRREARIGRMYAHLEIAAEEDKLRLLGLLLICFLDRGIDVVQLAVGAPFDSNLNGGTTCAIVR